MKVKLWGTRGSIPFPVPGRPATGATRRASGSPSPTGRCSPRRRQRHPQPRPGFGGVARMDILLTHLHLDHILGLAFFAPAFRPKPSRDLGPGLARGLAARPHRPSSPPRSRRSRCASCPARLLPPRARHQWRSARRGSPPRRRPSRPHPRLPDRRRRSSLTYIPDHEPALGADLDQLEESGSPASPSPGHLAADPRRPVHRRRVPLPRRLGPLGAGALARLRPPHRGRAHRPLPPRPDALRRFPRPFRRGGQGALGWRWAARPTKTIELGKERAEYELSVRAPRPAAAPA